MNIRRPHCWTAPLSLNSNLLPRAALCLFLCTGLVSPLLASDSYVPYMDSLDASQKLGYMRAAPSGQDQPLVESIGELVVDSVSAIAQESSRLERLAELQAGPLSLDETQQGQASASDLEQFGYDIFNHIPSTFAPVSGIPVPENYRVGPGDSIIVQLFGKRNVEYKLVVTRDGNILVPQYGPVKVNGLTFDEVEQLLVEGFERRVIGAKAVVTMGELRTIQIRLTGDVVQPGIYTIGGLSSFVDALLTTGGVKRTGSLRNISLIRDGKRIANMDLYSLLQKGLSNGDSYLAHNDTIFVPPIGKIIYVSGEVQRPAIYELGRERTLGQIIEMAGGLLPTASLDHSLIERIKENGTRTLIDFLELSDRDNDSAVLKTLVKNGDFVRVLPLEDELEDVILLSGHVKRPGGYQYRNEMRISDILSSVDMLLPGADVDFLMIKREQAGTLRTEILYAQLMEVLENPSGVADLFLRARDQIVVFNMAQARSGAVAGVIDELDIQATDYRPARVVETFGAVRNTGRLPLQEGARLTDVLSLAGGLHPGADLHYGVIARTVHPSLQVEILHFEIAAAYAELNSSANMQIEPGDRLYFFDHKIDRSILMGEEIERLRLQSRFGANEKTVSVMGEVQHSGVYPLTRGMRASDLLCAARGLSRKAYSLGAELSRIEHNDAGGNTVAHISLDSVALLKLCDHSREAMTGLSIAQELQQRYTDDLKNPKLFPMDQLSFSEKSGWVERATVTIRGEVSHPGIYAIDRGETLCQVLKRAGGATQDAYGFGASFTRRSVREMQQRTIDELHAQLDDLMVELSLSHSFNNDDKTSEDWGGKQDYLKAIGQLEKAEATGRMVIDLKKITKCRSRNALALEDGDQLNIPRAPAFVQVAGQVYVPTSHLYSEDRKIADYVELSGGHTVLGRLKDTYVIQANGEVLNYKGSRTSSRIARKAVMPGARIYVPINVDRMNGTEKAQSWLSSLTQSAILAGIVL